MSRGWIGVDLDGTLARYDGWRGPGNIGEPIPAMLERVKLWLRDGKDVRIFTARVGPQPNGEDKVALAAIRAWCAVHVGQVLEVTATKDYGMVELWDDRAVQVVANTGARADGGPAAQERKLELELLLLHPLQELVAEAAQLWDGTVGSFHVGEARAAAERTATRLASLVAPRLAALDREVQDLARDRGRLERDLAAERRTSHALSLRVSKLQDELEHVRWVGAMTLGIAEGSPGWALVKEYPAGHPQAEGAPAIRAVKELRRNLVASLERESSLMGQLEREKVDHAAARKAFASLSAAADATRQELEQLRTAGEPEDLSEPEALPCPRTPDAGGIVACLDALNPANRPENVRCDRSEACHQVLQDKAPGLVRLHEAARRVASPA